MKELILGYLSIHELIFVFLLPFFLQMNGNTRKLLDDARNKKFDDVLIDLEFDDIDINAPGKQG